MANFRRIAGLLLIGVLSFGCSDEVEDPIDLGYDYYPLALGQERVYVVDSITFRPLASGVAMDSTRFFLREVVVDTFRDAANALRYRIDQYERPDEGRPWRATRILSASRDERVAVWQEENLPYIKLVFPLRAGATWQGNRYFADDTLRQRVAGELIEVFKEWSSEAVSVDEPLPLENLAFASVATVRHADFESLVDIRRVEEKYARGVGLVYREMVILDSQCGACCGGDTGLCLDTPWRERAEAGFLLRQRLIDFR